MLPDVYTRLSSYIKETNVKGTFWNCPLPNEKKKTTFTTRGRHFASWGIVSEDTLPFLIFLFRHNRNFINTLYLLLGNYCK